jgi:hypothetical protein
VRSRRPRRITGPTTRAGARAEGLTDRHLRDPALERLSRDTYLPRALADDVGARLAAVLLTAPATAVASHLTAAAMWGLQVPLQDRDDHRIDITVPGRTRSESRRDRRVHRLPLEGDDVTTRWAQPVTSPARTWRDLAGILEPAALLAVTDQVVARHCPPSELERQLTRRPTGRGSARARVVLPLADPRAESPMESVLRWLVHVAGLPRPELQVDIRDSGGSIGRADMAWPDRRLIVEFDGDLHRDRDVFVKDLRRQNRLVTAGWTVLRFTSADVLGRPDDVIAAIRAALR